MPGFLRVQPDGLLLAVKLQPRASANEIAGPLGDELLRLLAGTLDCPRGAVELIRGHTSRHKLLRLRGLDPSRVRAALTKSVW
jgi:uncharacterized protein YggU (UPF0235/DUF167 family)